MNAKNYDVILIVFLAYHTVINGLRIDDPSLQRTKDVKNRAERLCYLIEIRSRTDLHCGKRYSARLAGMRKLSQNESSLYGMKAK